MNAIRLRYTALPLVLLLVLGMSQTGCSGFNNTGKGAAAGAAGGGVVGAVIGRATGSTARGAIIGAAVGGAAGAIIGRQMDKQAAELEDDLPDDVVVTPQDVDGDGDTDGIAINFNNDLLFDLGRSTLRSGVQADLRDLAASLNRYPEYDLTIVGHASTDGSTQLNQNLSDARARAVRDFLAVQGVSGGRMASFGRGEMEPLAGIPGESPLNRRVEIAIYPSDELRQNLQDPAYRDQYQRDNGL